MNIKTKYCPHCKQEKPFEHFRKWNTNDYSLWCKDCHKKQREKRQQRNQTEVYTVYGLFDPLTNECRYVGVTSQPKGRLSQHITDAKNGSAGNLPKCDWICDLLDIGLKPEMRTLEKTNAAESKVREEEWIYKMLSVGQRLFNSQGFSKEERKKRLQ